MERGDFRLVGPKAGSPVHERETPGRETTRWSSRCRAAHLYCIAPVHRDLVKARSRARRMKTWQPEQLVSA